MTKDEALDLALASLENWKCVYPEEWDAFDEEAITAIKQARLAPVQEPVGFAVMENPINPPAAQRQWVELTPEKIDELMYRFAGYELLYAIEAELRSKNG